MKKIIINGVTLAKKEIYGVQRHTYEILKELDGMIGKNEVEVVVPKKAERKLGFKNITLTFIDIDVNNKKALFIWNLLGFHRFCKKRGGISADLTLSYPMLGSDITAVYDCIVEKIRQNSVSFPQKIKSALHIARVFINLKRAKHVITCSRNSKKDICRFYHISPEKVSVIYSAWQHFESIKTDGSVLERLGLEKGKYCFSLGSRFYHKNFRWIAAAASQNPQYRFVISGSSLLSTSDDLLNSEAPGNLIFAGYLKDEEVKALMRSCRVFILPSLYEGFGIPPMEAMSTGARCIVSDTSSLPEIYGDSVYYIDPLRYNGIDIDRIISAEIRDNSEVLNRFSWKKSAYRFKKVIDGLQGNE